MLGIKIQPFLLSVLMLMLTFSLQAQEVSFEATTDAREVVENNSFSVVFTLRNAEGSGFRPPAFDGFRVLRGPNRSVSTQISNGVVRSEKSYTYTLLARGEGTYTIGPASILVNGKKLTTEPVQVKVVKGKEGVEKDLNQVTVRVIPSVVDAVVGQQIIIDYKLYTTVNVDSYNVIEESDYQGFFAQDIKRFDSRVIREVEDGVQYVTKVLKRVALFPQQAGALTIEPMLIQIGIVEDDDPARRRSMFFNRNIKRTAIETEPLTINVSSLPGDAPVTFSGAVGQYQVSSRLNRKMMTTDDVLSVRIAVQGNGDVKRIQPPELNLPEGFDAYDPKVKDESAYEINGEIVGKKEFEYLVLPKKPGTYNIAPAFTFYNPDSAKYVTIEDDVFPLNVR
ncbi:MAG: BatD family protein, partial [Saprospiraceae bacterium]|nr:BatD family protein [Saprospiraceae bacterium]